MKGIGIIGCGKISQIRHIPEYLDNPSAKIVGVCDFNMERARQIAEQLGAKAYSSAEELLADPQIDAVSVCVANNAHCEVTVKALRAGKDVLCEKPMATNIEECELMVRTAAECGRKLMIGQNQRLAMPMSRQRSFWSRAQSAKSSLSVPLSGILGLSPGALTRGGEPGSSTGRKLSWESWLIWEYTRPTLSSICSGRRSWPPQPVL